jgi:hypothetical protein
MGRRTSTIANEPEPLQEPAPAGSADTTPDEPPRKRKSKRKGKPKPPRYTLKIEAEVNGSIRRATIYALDQAGSIKATDKANLMDAAELRKAARRLAKNLKADAEELEADLSTAWVEQVNNHRRKCEQAGAGSAEGVPDSAASCSTPGPHCSPGSQYKVDANRIYLVKHTRDAGDVLEPLANFTARIIGEDVIDDGSSELKHVFRIEGTLYNGRPLSAVAVSSNDFAGMTWVMKSWGCCAIPAAGLGAKDHLRAAIQAVSGDPPRRTIYQHTGWRMIGGKPYYLHAGGGIGAVGLNPDVLVQLDGNLSRYSLPAPPDGETLADGIRAVQALLSMKPARIFFPCMGAVFRASLPARCDTSIFLIGPTGGGKSEIAAIMQRFYGASMDRLNLPGNWSSTANSLEGLAFLAKDALLTIDDFKPGGSKHDIDQWHAKADRVLRAQGNGSGRGRCRPDGTPRPDRPPRGLIQSTGEDVPRGESLQARNMPIAVAKADFQISDLTPHQQVAEQGVYAGVLAAYQKWLASNYATIQERLPDEFAALRNKAMAEFTAAHARIPGAVADLCLGLKYFLDFATSVYAIEPWDRETLAQQGWVALLEAARQQARAVEGQDPASRFLRLVTTVLTSGRGHVTSPNAGQPADPEMWGWKSQCVGTGNYASDRWEPQGKQVGWIDGINLYLDPEASYAEVQRLGDEQGEHLPLTQQQLFRRLKESGRLVSHEKEKTTTRRSLQGRERSVLHLPIGALGAQKPGEPGEQGD